MQNDAVAAPLQREVRLDDLRIHAYKLRRNNPGSVSHAVAADVIDECAAEIERLKADARDARPTLEQERAEAERQYMTGAFDYGTAPIGSRDWCLYWAGWLARSTAAMQKGGA